MTKVLSGIAYVLGAALFVAVGVEILFRIFAVDPVYYWKHRFLFVSPNSFQNRGEGVWTFRPHTVFREVAVYGLPSGFTAQPNLTVEYDCQMRSNNLGLLQDKDILPGTRVTIVLGDSFTSGQGGCPWVHKLQARRPQDQLLNAGLFGTGFDQWWRLFEVVRNEGVIIERVLIISISNDFKRRAWTWKEADLDCINNSHCTRDDEGSRQTLRADETQDELIERARGRYAKRFAGYTVWRFGLLTLVQHSLLLKFGYVAVRNLVALNSFSTAGRLPETDAALAAFKALGVPIKVLMVTQRDEVGLLGHEADAKAAVAALEEHRLPYDWCRLNYLDYLSIDGHPNPGGYNKLMECADRTLNEMK